ncbi:MAG: flagellar biosynthetic protein FliR [Pseudomonadota bacterium]
MLDPYINPLLATFLISLRIAPTFAFAPPFTLLRIPPLIRVLAALSVAAWMVAANPGATSERVVTGPDIVLLFAGELFLGIALMLSLQLAFAALLMAGRTIDVQAGFGLALLIDPTSQAQTPLIGTVFAYAAAAVFFASGGPQELLAVWFASLESFPIGSSGLSPQIGPLLSYVSTVFFIAMGLAGLALLTLFLIDLTVAFMSRTLPQMNVLLLGFQVKTLALLAVLPVTIAVSGTVFLRLVRVAIDAAPAFV